MGWRQISEDDDTMIPVFCWPTRQAADFTVADLAGAPRPLIRPFPHTVADVLDNKAHLAAHLAAAGCAHIHPPTWTAENFMKNDFPCEVEQGLWFVKHSVGVKGNKIQLFTSTDSLVLCLEELGSRGRPHYIVQRA